MPNRETIIQRLIEKDEDSLKELYDTYHRHLSHLLTNTGTDSSDHEKIMTKLFCLIWSSPTILTKDKHLSVALTKLCLKLIKGPYTSAS
ncbi:hypothetical protein [Pseudalkalibacillus hwajinpoensis]|uniref:hypothetical protein n=1 Tax=Guptibacillus hwajinpoensis TaxID=208199 RepID=UPI001CFDFDA3|nr:hypothetical protein [Pseudalkalibacillus hwajinpoensis]